MKQFSPVISFLAFFFTLICFLDLTLPNNGKLVHIVKDYRGKFEEVMPNDTINNRKGQFIWVESTRILKQPMRYYTVSKDKIKIHESTFNLYTPGIVFVVFLAIGSIYGVFFKKPAYQDTKVLYYNLIVSFFLYLMYIFSAGNVV